MSERRPFEMIAAVSALLTTLFMVGNGVTLLLAVGGHSDAMFDGAQMLPLGAAAGRMFHVSMVLDLLAYLALAPVTVFCWSRLKDPDEGLMSLYAFCGVAYSLLGAIGAVVVDAVIPPMMGAYAAATASQQEIMQLSARFLYQAVEHGIWNPLEVLMVSIWFLGLGLALRRLRGGLGFLAIAAGVIGLLDPIGWAIGSDTVLSIGAFGNILIPIWTAWFGVSLLRNPLFLGAGKGLMRGRELESAA